MMQRSDKYKGSGGCAIGRFSAICVALLICALIAGCTVSIRHRGESWDTFPHESSAESTAATESESLPPVVVVTSHAGDSTGEDTTRTVIVGGEDDPEKLTTRPLDTSADTEPPVTVTADTEPPPPPEPIVRLEAREAVGPEYFSDAVFIGDSRTVGLSLYSGLRSHYYSQQGLNVSSVASSAFIASGDEKLTLAQALEAQGPFTKVYVSFGINEIGWPSTDSFIASYGKLLDLVQEKLPDAVIYVQEILPMAKATAENERYAPMGGNGKVAEYNGRLFTLAKERGIYYVALTEIFADENGDLNVTDSFDGIHLGVQSSRAWVDYLQTHTAPEGEENTENGERT